MKKIYWGLIILGIVGSFASIFIWESTPILMAAFFGFYLLVIYALFTYYFENIKGKKVIPELLNKKSLINS